MSCMLRALGFAPIEPPRKSLSDPTVHIGKGPPPKPPTAADRNKSFHAGGPVKAGGAGEVDSFMGGFSGSSDPFRYDRSLPEL
jgi:hypothetical protein